MDEPTRTNWLRLGPRPASAVVTVVVVHGRDQDPGVAASDVVAPVLERLGPAGDDVAWVLPAAEGGRWYPLAYDAPRAANEPHLTRAVTVLADVERRLEADDVDPETVVWFGFSQGACVVGELLVRHPARRVAVLLCTGAVPGAAGEERPSIDGDLAATPVFLSAGAADPWIDVDRVRSTADLLRGAGAATEIAIFDDDGHVVRDTEIDALARAIVELLAPGAGAASG